MAEEREADARVDTDEIVVDLTALARAESEARRPGARAGEPGPRASGPTQGRAAKP